MGAGGPAHPLANFENAGFMSPQDKSDIYHAQGNPIRLKPGTDITTLDTGSYEGDGLNGTSWGDGEDGYLRIWVFKTTPDFYQIFELESHSGSLKMLTHHGDGTTMVSGWSSIERVNTLWQGNISSIGTKIILSQEASKFSSLIITCTNGSGVVSTNRIPYAPSIAFETQNLYNNAPGLSFGETALRFDGKQANLYENLLYNSDQQGVYINSAELPNIIKIEGVK